MLMPSILKDNIFDNWMDFSFPDIDKNLYGACSQNVMKTDIRETEQGYELDIDLPGFKKEEINVTETHASLAEVLAKHLELDKVTLIQCGGKDTIASEREQWNDGSNTLCIEPGKVVVYDRNYVTNQILRENGIRVLEMSSSELSRGRGGPRCMSMPLERESIEKR